MNELHDEGKIVRGFDEESNFKYYNVPKERIDEIKALIENRQIAQEIENLPKSERDKILAKMREDDDNKILRALALGGPMLIPEMAGKTGFTEKKILEAIWGPLIALGLVTTDKKYWMSRKERVYSLDICGLYRAIREDIEHLENIAEKWGHLHLFFFQ